jgi:hypothetical protein
MYKFYFNFPTANQKALKKYIVHKTDHVESNSVGSSHNGIMVDDFKTLDELLKALKILIRKFRKKENPHTIVYCKRCFPAPKKKK